jgi:uncharacterized membrane protein
MEESLRAFAGIVARPIEAMAVLIVAFGALEAFVGVIAMIPKAPPHGARKAVWRRFGMWLLLGLEFELGRRHHPDGGCRRHGPTSACSPRFAAVRTFLNYFLEQDLEHAERTAEV